MQVVMNMLLTPSAVIDVAKQDAWASAIVALVVSLFITWCSLRLCSKFPGLEFNQVSEKVLGKWIGRFLSLLLLLSLTIVLAAILRQYAEFISGTILPKTPVSVIVACILLVAIYPTIHGIGVVGRLAEILGPILIIGIILPTLLGLSNVNLGHLLPLFYDSGTLPILKGSLGPAVFLMDSILIVWLYNRGSNSSLHKINKFVLLSIFFSGVLYMITVTIIVSTFGVKIASAHLYPFLMLVRYTAILGIIENLDSIVITVWILSIFLKICLYLFVTSYGFSSYTKQKNWKRFIWIISIITFILSLFPKNVSEISIVFPKAVGIPFILPLWAGLPIILLVGCKLRFNKPHKQSN